MTQAAQIERPRGLAQLRTRGEGEGASIAGYTVEQSPAFHRDVHPSAYAVSWAVQGPFHSCSGFSPAAEPGREIDNT